MEAAKMDIPDLDDSDDPSPKNSSPRTQRAENAYFAKSADTIGFDNQRYLEAQKTKIMERLARSGDKLYIEFGGKLLFDLHAARVLPGYDPNVKIKLLKQMSDSVDIILCVNACDIERHKVRMDFGITYDLDVLKMIDELRSRDVQITAVVITQYCEQRLAMTFKTKLERRDIKVYVHPSIPGYPADIDTIVSDKGYGACQYIETTKKIVVVTAPGPGSGKLATCLSQLYHEFKRGVKAGYAKFETFPVWNMPLKHPVNVAYEAATLDLNDSNLIDHFHKDAYGVQTVNYNRDIEAYPVLKLIFERIMGHECMYKSPTDMGVNCIFDGVVDDEVCCQAARQEIIRRYFRCLADFTEGAVGKEMVNAAQRLMTELKISPEERKVVPLAREAAAEAKQMPGKGNHGIMCGAAIQLKDGTIIKGRNSPQLHSASAVLINAGKHLAGMPENIHLIPPITLDAIGKMKKDIYQTDSPSLDVTEMFIALSVSTTMNPSVGCVLEKLSDLYGCEMHLTHIPTIGDANGLRKLGVQFTYDPAFSSRRLFDV